MQMMFGSEEECIWGEETPFEILRVLERFATGVGLFVELRVVDVHFPWAYSNNMPLDAS